MSLRPEIRDNDPDIAELLERLPSSPISASGQVTSTPGIHGHASISQLLNNNFVVSSFAPEPQSTLIRTDDKHLVLHIADSSSGIINSDEMQFNKLEDVLDDSTTDTFVTSNEYIRSLKTLQPHEQAAFHKAKLEEIKFLISEAMKITPEKNVPQGCDIQPLKWILSIKRSPNSNPPVRFRARLVSASHSTTLRHALNGNAPTIAVSTIRIMLAIAPLWNRQLKRSGDSLLILVRDVTKAYIQSQPTKRLVFYKPPPEFFHSHPDSHGMVWQALVQIYGDVEAGKYWCKTFVPWLCEHILDYKQSMYDPSLLYSPTAPAATGLCTDDSLTLIPASKRHEESKMAQRFKCRDANTPPIEFKGLDISEHNGNIEISQTCYSKTINISDDLDSATKPDLNRPMTEEEISKLRSDAGKLAWIAVGSSPLSSFQASVALQRNREQKIPLLSVLKDTHNALKLAKERDMAKLTYVPLDPESIHIRLYTDGAFQNLATKHSQIGFLIGLADKNDNFNVVHWHSSRAPRRPSSTEQSELMALDVGFRCLENMRKIVFQLLKRETPIVVYTDCETLWANLMNETVPTIPEIGYRCREFISEGKASSVCLIPGPINPADAFTKAKPSHKLSDVLRSNKCITPCKRVFMLQNSPSVTSVGFRR